MKGREGKGRLVYTICRISGKINGGQSDIGKGMGVPPFLLPISIVRISKAK